MFVFCNSEGKIWKKWKTVKAGKKTKLKKRCLLIQLTGKYNCT